MFRALATFFTASSVFSSAFLLGSGDHRHSKISECSNGDSVKYFAYGSNMSAANRAFKEVNVLVARRAILDDWALVFNFGMKGNKEDPAPANVQPDHMGSSVHGVLFEMTPEEMDKLDRLEAMYDKPCVKVRYYPEDGGGSTHAYVYYAYPSFIELFDENGLVEQGNFLPGRNYMDTLIVGARENKLDPKYLKTLEDVPALSPKPLDFAKIVTDVKLNGQAFSSTQVSESRPNSDSPICSALGLVIEIKTPFEAFARLVGKDITQTIARRWAFSDAFIRLREANPNWATAAEANGWGKPLQVVIQGQRQTIPSKLNEYMQRQVVQLSKMPSSRFVGYIVEDELTFTV